MRGWTALAFAALIGLFIVLDPSTARADFLGLPDQVWYLGGLLTTVVSFVALYFWGGYALLGLLVPVVILVTLALRQPNTTVIAVSAFVAIFIYVPMVITYLVAAQRHKQAISNPLLYDHNRLKAEHQSLAEEHEATIDQLTALEVKMEDLQNEIHSLNERHATSDKSAKLRDRLLKKESETALAIRGKYDAQQVEVKNLSNKVAGLEKNLITKDKEIATLREHIALYSQVNEQHERAAKLLDFDVPLSVPPQVAVASEPKQQPEAPSEPAAEEPERVPHSLSAAAVTPSRSAVMRSPIPDAPEVIMTDVTNASVPRADPVVIVPNPETAIARTLPAILAPAGKRPGITLKIQRSQRTGGLTGSKVLFALDVRIDVAAEEAALIKKYGLGKMTVYDSEARKKHADASYGHFDDAVNTPGFTATSAGKSLWKNARGLASAAMMALSLRVTLNSLMEGHHIECKDLDELLGAENAILDACKTARTYLDLAATFDGREEVVEF